MPLVAETWIRPPAVLIAVGLTLLPHLVRGQAPRPANGDPPASAAASVTVESIDARLAEVEAATDLDEAAKTRIKSLYQEARQLLEQAALESEQAAQFQAMAASAEERLAAARMQLAQAPAEDLDIPADADQGSLQQRLSDAEQEVAQARSELNRLNAEPSRRQARLRELPDELAAAKDRSQQVQRQLATPPPAGEPPVLTAARQAYLQASLQAVQQEIDRLEREQQAYAATTELLPLQRDLAARQLAAAEARRQQLAATLQEQRQQEINEQLERARRNAAETHPALRPLAEANRELAEEARESESELNRTTRELKQRQAVLENVSQQFERTREKVESVGLTDALGILLRADRDRLLKTRQLHRPPARRESQVRDVQLRVLELEDLRAELANLDDVLPQWRSAVGEAAWTDAMERHARALLEARRDTLDTLIQNQRSLFESLVALDSTEHELVEQIDTYAAYIDGRILWVRSAPPLSLHVLPGSASALQWMFDPDRWQQLAALWLQGIRGNLLIYVSFAAGLLLLICQQRRMRRRLSELGREASRRGCHQFRYTPEAVAATTGIAALWPTLLCFLGLRLDYDAPGSELAPLLSRGLVAAGIYLLWIEFLRQMCRPHGLAQAHLGWDPMATAALRRYLRLLALTSLLVFLAVFFQHHGEDLYRQTLGRAAFVVLMLLIAVSIQRLLRSRAAIFNAVGVADASGLLYRLRLPLAMLIMTLPLCCALLAATGYYFSAYELAMRLMSTAYLALGLVLLYGLQLRWILIRRRRLALAMRQKAAAGAAERESLSAGVGEDIPVESEPVIGLSEISDQTRHLMRVVLLLIAAAGTWWIWTEFVPALNLLDTLVLWKVSVDERVEVVTARHLLICLTLLFVTAVAVRNLPGLLELLFLKRLPLDSGARYAVATISRYLIGIVGLVVALSLIRVQWSQYGWLVAAATVGLGFGLQEIFANFVSGLIVLLERPIRVGDVVTVDGTTGVVSRIHMRATVVTNWDRQELIVPNKEFVTSKLLNWTLTSAVTRLTLEVGVAYGSDTRKSRGMLMDIATSHPRVLDDPEPIVTLERMGDSTLVYSVRVYVPTLADRLPVTNDLNERIHEEFAAAGIEIAFPQRDLHLRTWPGHLSFPPPDDQK